MEKYALVIGIDVYQFIPHLRSSVNDATDVDEFFKSVGFETELLLNATHGEFLDALAGFCIRAKDNSVSIIYFSGHGLQVNGYNYLVCSDSEVRNDKDVKYHCIDVDDLLIKKEGTHLVILDACRNNPFYSGIRGARLGLTSMAAPEGTLIAFSTAPGSTSIERTGERNGVYTGHLLSKLHLPNTPIEMLFKYTRQAVIDDTQQRQIPWEQSSLYGDDFYFIRRENTGVMERIESLVVRDFHLVQVPPILSVLESIVELTMAQHQFYLTLLEIALWEEYIGLSETTLDSDYSHRLRFDTLFIEFEERLLSDVSCYPKFDSQIMDKIIVIGKSNYGFAFIEEDELYTRLLVNEVEFAERNESAP